MAAEAPTALRDAPQSGSTGASGASASGTQPEVPESSTAAAPAKASSKENPKSTKGKSKTAKSKSAKGDGDPGGSATGKPSVAGHPRAARSVARAKGWGGLAGFLIAGYFSLPTATLAEAGLRALVAGSVCYVAAWAGAVFVWRRLVMIEIQGRQQQLLASAQAQGGVGEPAVASLERSGAGGQPRGR
jgi:hypothetical protein